MNITKQLLTKIIDKLVFHNFITEIIDTSILFYDEPKIFSYSAKININSSNFAGPFGLSNTQLGGAGVSIKSRELALLKCLSEVIERISLVSYHQKEYVVNCYTHLKNAIDLSPYLSAYKKINNIGNLSFKWIKGTDIYNQKEVYIPMQLIYLGYKLEEEIPLTGQISTGAAGGFSKEAILLRGIYEVIERDSLMTTYLNAIKVRRIKLQSISDDTVVSLISTLKNYYLDLFLFDITNDLEIPTYLSILMDNTNTIGCPKYTVGYKSRINVKEAIIGSIEEALMGRTAQRYNFYSVINKNKKSNSLQIRDVMKAYVQTHLNNLNYLINLKPKPLLKYTNNVVNDKEELNIVMNKLLKKNFKIYYADITLNMFKDLNHKVYKVIIPGLQPYLPETYEEFRIDRLKSVAEYFGLKDYLINKVPHPFV